MDYMFHSIKVKIETNPCVYLSFICQLFGYAKNPKNLLCSLMPKILKWRKSLFGISELLNKASNQ